MQFDAILEVAIGLVFVWLVISVATMEGQNRIGNLLNWRADYLERSIYGMLKDKTLVEKFYNHPLILELAKKDKEGKVIINRKGKVKRPDYIPNPIFATAAFEVIMNAGKEGEDVPVDTMSIEQMKASMNSLVDKNPQLAHVTHYIYPKMESIAENVDAKIAEYRKNTEGWFDNVMSQTSSWYKIRAQWLAFFIGLSIAIIINVDTIHIAQKLWQEPTTRAVIVAQAQSTVQSNTLPENITFADAKSLNFPIGWTTTTLQANSCTQLSVIDYQLVIRSAGKCLAVTSLPSFNNGWGILAKLAGFLLTALAAAQGAPFWFDILRKLVGVKQQTAPAK